MAYRTSSISRNRKIHAATSAKGELLYATYQADVLNKTWNTSTKVGGRFVVPQAMTRQKIIRSVSIDPSKRYTAPVLTVQADSASMDSGLAERRRAMDFAYAGAYSRFTSDLKQRANAELGMALAFARQTSSLVMTNVSRAASLAQKTYTEVAHWFANWLERQRHLVRRKQWRSLKRHYRDLAQKAGSETLAFKFGVQPLVSDATSAVKELVRFDPKNVFVSRRRYEKYQASGEQTGSTWSAFGRARVTISGRASVSSPNLALANRLGLLNVAGVAWDIIPWSWVAGMFVNISQVLRSMTDFVGYTFVNRSVTSHFRTVSVHYAPATATSGAGSAHVVVDYKRRTVQQYPMPPLNFRIPEMNLGLVTTAAALAAQRINKLGSLLDKMTRVARRG